MRVIRPFTAVLFFPLLLLSAQAADPIQFKVEWPPDAVGTYRLIGDGQPTNLSKESSTSTVAEGGHVRLVGSGFDIGFDEENGQIKWPHEQPPLAKFGIHFDTKTNTFSFTVLNLRLTVKNYPFPVILEGTPVPPAASATPPGAAPGTDTASIDLKVIQGKHTLNYGPNKVAFTLDQNDVVTLQDAPPGVSASGTTISIEGLPYQVTTASTHWNFTHSNLPAFSGNAAVYLLPGAYGFESNGATVPFVVNHEGLLSSADTGPYAEVVALADAQSAPLAKVMIPDGEAKYAARIRQEKIDQALHDQVLTASAKAAWKKDFPLVEYMKVYDFPEEQLTYPVNLPAGTESGSLKLLAFTEKKVQVIPFQLSTRSGKETLSFRTDLPKGATRLFRLVSGFDARGIPEITPDAPTLNPGANPQEAELSNGEVILKVCPRDIRTSREASPSRKSPDRFWAWRANHSRKRG
jgi:hypothetical protein